MFITRNALKETLIVILVAVIAFSIAFHACVLQRERGQKPQFYQSYYEPAIRMACGQPFGVDSSGKITDEMKRFLRTGQETLSCESVTPVTTLEKNPPTRAWYHLFVATALIWKVTGISWPVLDGFASALLAIAAVMIYALSRLLMPSPIAAILAVMSILPGLRFLFYLRDVNKAPFILAALFVATWLVIRTQSRMRLCSMMAALGVWLGIGYGFRPDVLIVLPLLIVTVFFFRHIPLKKGWLDGVMASVVLCTTFLIAMSPVFPAFNAKVGTATWHFGLLGLSDAHTSMLGLKPANYSWLSHYDDLLVWRSVESYGERVLSLPSVGYCTPLYDKASKALYLDIFKTFPGDFMTRGLAAAQDVIGYGFWGIPWIELFPTGSTFFSNHRGFMHIAPIVGWIAIVLIALASNVRLGLFSVLALAYLGCYPAIQFDQRHYFHLAFLAWLPAGIILGWLVQAAVSKSRPQSLSSWSALLTLPRETAWVRSTAILLGIVSIIYAIFWGVRYYQTTAVHRLFDHYLKATGNEAVVTTRHDQGGNIVLTISPPERSDQKKLNARMLRLDIGGTTCTASPQKISVELGGDDPAYVFKKDLMFDFKPDRTRVMVFVPVYFQQQRLTTLSLVMPQQGIGCVEGATWLSSDELPSLWVHATLYQDWRGSRLYQTR